MFRFPHPGQLGDGNPDVLVLADARHLSREADDDKGFLGIGILSAQEALEGWIVGMADRAVEVAHSRRLLLRCVADAQQYRRLPAEVNTLVSRNLGVGLRQKDARLPTRAGGQDDHQHVAGG